MEKIKEILHEFKTITLEDTQKVKLMKRIDKKYILDIDTL